MSFLSKELELKKFIYSKVIKKKQINYSTILHSFTKVYNDSCLKCYKRLQNFYWIEECNIIIFNIFWCVFCFTYNIKLTMFLCERAIMLFNEYIDLANHTFKENEQNFTINSTDVKLFIYKRTIGPIILKSQTGQYKNKIGQLKQASILIKLILNRIVSNIINIYSKKETQIYLMIEKHTTYFLNLIPDILSKLYRNNLVYSLDISKLNFADETQLIKFINKMKYDCELTYFLYKLTNKNLQKTNELITILLEDTDSDLIEDCFHTKKTYNAKKIKYIQNNKKKFKQIVTLQL